MSRLADQFAIYFLLLTLAIAGGAYFVTGDKMRLLAVLVISTPASRPRGAGGADVRAVARRAHGVLVKGGEGLEALARARVLILDKTGTLTKGGSGLETLHSDPSLDGAETLRLGASLDQASPHAIASALVHLAVGRGLRLTAPVDVQEDPGAGIQGVVEGKRVAVGSLAFLRAQALLDGAVPTTTWGYPGREVRIALNGRLAAILQVTDEAREEARRAIDLLRMLGIAKVVFATGDTAAIAGEIAAKVGIDTVAQGSRLRTRSTSWLRKERPERGHGWRRSERCSRACRCECRHRHG